MYVGWKTTSVDEDLLGCGIYSDPEGSLFNYLAYQPLAETIEFFYWEVSPLHFSGLAQGRPGFYFLKLDILEWISVLRAHHRDDWFLAYGSALPGLAQGLGFNL